MEMEQKRSLPLPGATDPPVCFTRFDETLFLKETRVSPADECPENGCSGNRGGQRRIRFTN